MPQRYTALELLLAGVEGYERWLTSSGQLVDPVFGEPTQYSTPYYAFCNAALARLVPHRRRELAHRALLGLKASLEHVASPGEAPHPSAFSRETGSLVRTNHRDFFWPPILRTYLLLGELGALPSQEIAQVITRVDPEACFRSRPPSNWAAVWLSGEWLRMRAGLSPTSLERFDAWLSEFFAGRVLPELGFYQEPGHPNSYDLFTRYHLLELLLEGYKGRWETELEQLLERGLERSLAVQLSDGSLASAHRSTGQTWTVAAQVAYFVGAAQWLRRRGESERAETAWQHARLALASLARWMRADGTLSPVENCLPPAWRVGYEPYTADAHYGSLALAMLASAVLRGFDETPLGDVPDRAPRSRVEGLPVLRGVLHAHGYSLHLNAWPARGYDAFGIVDLTFGPGRYLQFASSVRHLGSGALYNLGMARRREPGRAELQVMAQADLLSSGPRHDGQDALVVEAWPRGEPYRYVLWARLTPEGAWCRESTPGQVDHKTLLVPYVREAGTGISTEVEVSEGLLRLRHGREEVAIAYQLPVESVTHLPYGFENRRGLCGLVRVDFAGPREEISYRVMRIR